MEDAPPLPDAIAEYEADPQILAVVLGPFPKRRRRRNGSMLLSDASLFIILNLKRYPRVQNENDSPLA